MSEDQIEIILNQFYDSVEYRAAVHAAAFDLSAEEEKVIRDQLRRIDAVVMDGVPRRCDV